MDRGPWQATVHGVTRVGHDLATKPPPHHLIVFESEIENKYISSLVNLLYGFDFDINCKGEKLPALRPTQA